MNTSKIPPDRGLDGLARDVANAPDESMLACKGVFVPCSMDVCPLVIGGPECTVAMVLDIKIGHRIIATYNACVGMSDPAASIAALRAENERLRAALQTVAMWSGWICDVAADALRPATEAATKEVEK